LKGTRARPARAPGPTRPGRWPARRLRPNPRPRPRARRWAVARRRWVAAEGEEEAAGEAEARAAAGRARRSSPEMLLDLGQGRNLPRGAVGAVAVEQQVWDPGGRRAGGVLGGRVTDVQ